MGVDIKEMSVKELGVWKKALDPLCAWEKSWEQATRKERFIRRRQFELWLHSFCRRRREK